MTTRRLEEFMSILQSQDPAAFASIQSEEVRQRSGLELIASENYTSRAVMEACGSVLTNKYAEGYPGDDTMVAAYMLIPPSR